MHRVVVRATIRTLAILAAISAPAQQQNCMDDLQQRWNRFATDANAYVNGLGKGTVDAKLRGKLDREWKAVTGCECW